MTRFLKFPLSSDFKIHVPKKLILEQLPVDIQNQIESIWKEEKEERGDALYNGWLVHLEDVDENAAEGYLVEYKIYLAQCRSPELKLFLNIWPGAVNGITCAGDSILLGKRSSFVTLDVGCYELAPSGTLSQTFITQHFCNAKQELLRELQEEIGIPVDEVGKVTPLWLFKDTLYRSWEFVFKIELEPALISQQFPHLDEYTEFHWVSSQNVLAFLESKEPQVVALSKECIKHFF